MSWKKSQAGIERLKNQYKYGHEAGLVGKAIADAAKKSADAQIEAMKDMQRKAESRQRVNEKREAEKEMFVNLLASFPEEEARQKVDELMVKATSKDIAAQEAIKAKSREGSDEYLKASIEISRLKLLQLSATTYALQYPAEINALRKEKEAAREQAEYEERMAQKAKKKILDEGGGIEDLLDHPNPRVREIGREMKAEEAREEAERQAKAALKEHEDKLENDPEYRAEWEKKQEEERRAKEEEERKAREKAEEEERKAKKEANQKRDRIALLEHDISRYDKELEKMGEGLLRVVILTMIPAVLLTVFVLRPMKAGEAMFLLWVGVILAIGSVVVSGLGKEKKLEQQLKDSREELENLRKE